MSGKVVKEGFAFYKPGAVIPAPESPPTIIGTVATYQIVLQEPVLEGPRAKRSVIVNETPGTRILDSAGCRALAALLNVAADELDRKDGAR